jgi:hypothetical protein
MKNIDIFQSCFDNICKNYNIPAGLNISEPMRDRAFHTRLNVFIDLHTAAYISFSEKEICRNILETGVKSKKDYRRLRSLIRMRLIDAIHQVRDLTEESLRNLGAKI